MPQLGIHQYIIRNMVHLPGQNKNGEKSQNINLNYDKLLTLTKMPATENPPGFESSSSEKPRAARLLRRRDFASQSFSKLFLTAVN